MVLKVYKYGDEVLAKKALPVTEITDEIRTLVTDMFETCYKKNGVGLAAPQVGHSIRLFVLSIPPEDSDSRDRKDYSEIAMINPEILEKKGKQTDEEGCLSVPNIYEEVERAMYVTVRFMGLDGVTREFKTEGFTARVIQHENDHLDGVLFVERLPSLQKQFIKKKLDAKYNVM